METDITPLARFIAIVTPLALTCDDEDMPVVMEHIFKTRFSPQEQRAIILAIGYHPGNGMRVQ